MRIYGEPSNKSVVMTVRFTADDADRVRRIAQTRNVSSSDLIRQAVRAYTYPPPPSVRAQRGAVQAVYGPPPVVVMRPLDVQVGGTLGAVLTSR